MMNPEDALTDEVIDAAAKAAWMKYMGTSTFEEYCEKEGYQPESDSEEDMAEAKESYETNIASWPEETKLYPNADDFRACAKAAILSYQSSLNISAAATITPEQKALLESIADNPRTLQDVCIAIRAVLASTQVVSTKDNPLHVYMTSVLNDDHVVALRCVVENADASFEVKQKLVEAMTRVINQDDSLDESFVGGRQSLVACLQNDLEASREND